MARSQLYELGYTRSAIQTRLETDRLHRVHRGVYAVGHMCLTYRSRWMAAVLACGPGAALSHSDAAALHDLRTVPSGLIDVTAPSRHRLPGIRCHLTRRDLGPEACVVEGIPVTSVERTLLDVAERLGLQRLRSLLEQAERLRALDAHRLEAVIAAGRGHRGGPRLRAALCELTGDEPPWTQSDLERALLELTRAQRLPEPSTNVIIEGELVDAVWPDHRLVVEVDSWGFHQSRRSFEEDRRRDAKLLLCGWRVLRLTHRRIVHEADRVAGELRALLSGAGPAGRPARAGP